MKLIPLLILATVFLAPLVAETPTAEPASADQNNSPAAAPLNLGSFKYSGDQAAAWRWGVYNPATRTGGFLDSTMKAEYTNGDFKAVAGASIRYNEFFPEETALFWSPGSFKFGVGLQEFSWGVADKANPTDTLNARDYRYDIDAPRLVNPAASVTCYPVSWISIDAVYEPWKVESKYPTNFAGSTQAGLTNNANSLKTQMSNAAAYYAAYGPAATAAQYSYLSSALSAYAPSVTTASSSTGTFANPVWGGRVNFFFPGLDLSLSYLYDQDAFYTPVVSMQSYGGIWVPQSVNMVYNPIQRFGLNAKTTVEQFGFWLESAYNHTTATSWNDNQNRHDTIAWTAGMDFNYGPSSEFYVNIQYSGAWVMNYNASPLSAPSTTAQLTSQSYVSDYTYQSLTQSLGLQTEQMLNSLMLRMNWPLNNATVTPSFSSIVSVPYNYNSSTATRYASLFVNPEIDMIPVDGLHLLAGADLAYAWIQASGKSAITLDTTNDRLGVYTPQNNLYVKVVYKWNGTYTPQ